MARRARFVLVRGGLGLLLGSPLCGRAQQAGPAALPLVFEGVTVVDVAHGQLVPDRQVVIMGTRIQHVGPVSGARVPPGARVVDARGQYLIPGLWDMHVHLDAKIADLAHELFIVAGVTGFREAGWAGGIDDTLEHALQWRRAVLAGTRVGPPRQIYSATQLVAAPPCKGGTPHVQGEIPGQRLICGDNPADARRLIDSLKATGADMLKTYMLEPDLYYVIAAEARRIGIPFGGHLPASGAVSWSAASDSGASIIDHALNNFGGGCVPIGGFRKASVAECAPVAERFRRHGTWLVPTLAVYTDFGSPASQRIAVGLAQLAQSFAADSSRERNWLHAIASSGTSLNAPPGGSATKSGLLSIAQQVGLPLLAGTDATNGPRAWQHSHLPGFSLQAELAIYVAEGLTPLEALQSATLNPAKFLHATDSLGTVVPGKLADLVLLAGDPLADITNVSAIRGVVANGRYYDARALDSLWTSTAATFRTRSQQRIGGAGGR